MSKKRFCPTCGKQDTRNYDRHRTAVAMRANGSTWTAIGKRLGISPQAAQQLHRRAEEYDHELVFRSGKEGNPG